MTAPLRQALDRTLLLMRDEFVDATPDGLLLDALTETEVALVADAGNLASHSAQCAYVTAAMLMARSGHKIYILAPDVPLVGPQPPLKPGGLISSLMEINNDLLPDIAFSTELPRKTIDLEVKFGDSVCRAPAQRSISVCATAWSASLQSGSGQRWTKMDWPFGGMASGALSAGETFKAAMRKLRPFARNVDQFDSRVAATNAVDFELAPASALTPTNLGRFDFISAGAIANCSFFALSRILEVEGMARALDDDRGDITNLNRNALLLRSMIDRHKAVVLSSVDLGRLEVEPVVARFGPEGASKIGALAARVLVGVDHIPTRWEVQKAMPNWLGIGATTHWSAMASFHVSGLACAGCLHPTDDPDNGTVPTVAFVSFWAGLLLAAYFVRTVGGELLPANNQLTFLTPFRPNAPWRSPIAMRRDCPVGNLHHAAGVGVKIA